MGFSDFFPSVAVAVSLFADFFFSGCAVMIGKKKSTPNVPPTEMKFTGFTKYVSRINPSVGLPSETIQMKGKDFAHKMTPRAVLY